MQKPKIRSKVVDDHIKAAYARLAQAHFEEALKEVALSPENAHRSTDIRMVVIEDYLESAGAEATKWKFRA